ncbi:MAG: SDR family NAD(P)-dependent oxidoreductase [Candidatus Bipolaricaulota bacterium]|nr:SDR family NAD(P)-dependent oxidoreductase [Candidatus Bipolaricaulota bacterium]MCS7273886.1 SDR family NAD(P)-dependent oxidoreductase [Candidatus Bipolaricaulota bacterium]MDW8110317.1 SDR family NAD(P)-dependent oxidoreductase [Candidatus Bipolaricaulota bacterium]MDW8328787.1 SDR family NAD(P)-dependent oxidoreductase [Candidatus Bipolaricaulota bacterium]
MRLSNILVWGAAGGIGRALVASFAARGHTVVAVARQPRELETLTPHIVTGAVDDPEQVTAAVRRAIEVASTFDVFTYAVGDIASVKIAEMAPEDWRRIMDANLAGVYLTTRAALPYLASQAHLFFLGAPHERLRLPGLGAYAAAKAGIEALAEVIRKETRRRVTVVRPQAVRTPMWEKVPFRVPANALSPEQVAQAIVQAWEQGQEGILDL